MKNNLKLSIITINYNNLEGLTRTAKSITKTDNVEWIVIDGGSTDGSVEFIRQIEAQIDTWVSEPDGGIYDAMNKGTSKARGEYLIFMNSGDQFVPGILDTKFLNTLSTDIEYGDCIVTSDHENYALSKQPATLTFQNFYAGCICHQATFIRRSLQLTFPYDANLRLASCRRFFIDAIVFGNASIKYIPTPIAIYDTNGVSTTQKERLLDELDQFIEEYLPAMVVADMKRLKEYDRITSNSSLFSIIRYIHPFAGRKRIFEKLSTILAGIIFGKQENQS
jgi:glycosyltransferase involved in cell wall biosynthesis